MEQIQIGDSNSGVGTLRFDMLPEDCISMVISRTSPRDACVVASVSKTVKSAAESDLVWEKFLPPEYSSLVPMNHHDASKKEIYMSVADVSVWIDDGKKRFWLEKSSGKKCCMLSDWGDSPSKREWITVSQSKFKIVVERRNVCWLEIRGKISCGKISCGMLSRGTCYSVYAVFKRMDTISHGFDHTPVEVLVGFAGKEPTKKLVFVGPGGTDSRSGGCGSYCWVSHGAMSAAFSLRPRNLRLRKEVEGEREIGGGRNVKIVAERVIGGGRNVEVEAEREIGGTDSRSGGCGSYSGVSHGAVSTAFRLPPCILRPREEVEGEREIGGGRNVEVEGEREIGGGRNVEEAKERGDGWSEVELGKFDINNNGEEDCEEIEISITDWKSGLVIQGIEIRPERR